MEGDILVNTLKDAIDTYLPILTKVSLTPQLNRLNFPIS